MSHYIICINENGTPYLAHSGNGYKYIQKIKDGIRTRYFYTKAELDAYFKNKKTDGKAHVETPNRPVSRRKYISETKKVASNKPNAIQELVIKPSDTYDFRTGQSITNPPKPGVHIREKFGRPAEVPYEKLSKKQQQVYDYNALKGYAQYIKDGQDYIADKEFEMKNLSFAMADQYKAYKNARTKNEKRELYDIYADTKKSYLVAKSDYDYAIEQLQDAISDFQGTVKTYNKKYSIK